MKIELSNNIGIRFRNMSEYYALRGKIEFCNLSDDLTDHIKNSGGQWIAFLHQYCSGNCNDCVCNNCSIIEASSILREIKLKRLLRNE